MESVSNGLETPNREPSVVSLAKLKAGQTPFSSWSCSTLRVVRAGEVIHYQIPIKSIGIIDIIEQLARKAPTPPRKMQGVKASSPEGKALGLKFDRVVEVEDYMDDHYRETNRQFEINSTYTLVLHGLAMDIVDENDRAIVTANDEHSATEVHDEAAAIQILKSSGLTHDHVQQLARDIRGLTLREEEKIDQE